MAPPVVELQRVEQSRARLGDVDGIESAAGDREEGRAVRLDEIRLVDALLLDVGARVVDTLRRAGVARPRAGRRDRGAGDAAGDRPTTEAPRADERQRLRLHVAEQVAAGAKRQQASGVRSGRGRGLAGGRVAGGPAEAHGEHEGCRDECRPLSEAHVLVIRRPGAKGSQRRRIERATSRAAARRVELGRSGARSSNW